jgi:hypothetical protein
MEKKGKKNDDGDEEEEEGKYAPQASMGQDQQYKTKKKAAPPLSRTAMLTRRLRKGGRVLEKLDIFVKTSAKILHGLGRAQRAHVHGQLVLAVQQLQARISSINK